LSEFPSNDKQPFSWNIWNNFPRQNKTVARGADIVHRSVYIDYNYGAEKMRVNRGIFVAMLAALWSMGVSAESVHPLLQRPTRLMGI
jgi:hypothetical protein